MAGWNITQRPPATGEHPDTRAKYRWGELTVRPLLHLFVTSVCIVLEPESMRNQVCELHNADLSLVGPLDDLPPAIDETGVDDLARRVHVIEIKGDTASVLIMSGLEAGTRRTLPVSKLNTCLERSTSLDERGPEYADWESEKLRNALTALRASPLKKPRAPRSAPGPRKPKAEGPKVDEQGSLL